MPKPVTRGESELTFFLKLSLLLSNADHGNSVCASFQENESVCSMYVI